ncbi:epoxide hydrolase [Trichoderma arundinaceum]|uniref:Epoxide hydrolase n=1 Tax=Trichoderma arundinaceum TaxID=490622 RepID=A0A395NSX0_TRIAR|nr:epoxide hydrolase [Trichoderma arundinaceum]
MDTSKLKPNDPRVKYLTKQIRGKTYSYILGEPQGPKVDTVVLVHGWPDMAFGWRNQIPYFMSLGFQVIAPNMVGYAGTDAPQDLEEFSFKNTSADLAELAREYVGEKGQIVLGGHDWGGSVVWRLAYYYPELIKAVFSVCTPLHPLNADSTSLEDIIAAGGLPNFKYQLQLKGPDVQAHVQGKDKLRKFFKALYGGRGPNDEPGFNTSQGLIFDNLDKLGAPLLLDADELEYYVEQYSLQKTPELRGPLNWYRTREINAKDEIPRAKNGPPLKFEMPALFIAASKDAALPPSMAKGMDAAYTDLTRAEVNASHWALTQASDEVNSQIGKWLNKALNGAIKAAL